MCKTGLANLGIFYFDFRDTAKQNIRSLLSSIILQLSHQSDRFSEVLSSLYSTRGFQQPSIHKLTEYLEKMMKLPGQGDIYLIIDALDESPNSSGYPTQREQVLAVIRKFIELQLPHVHFCITSRPAIDIRDVLEPLAIYNVPLHEQAGQNQDIVDYIKHFIDSDPRVARWREEDKQLVIDALERRAGGM
jgi:hypothetical protein